MMVVSDLDDLSVTLNWNDDYVDNADTGISLLASQSGDVVSVEYSANNLGTNGTIIYSITYLA
jgi:hypothetical protein